MSLKLAPIFTDNMVLQRDANVIIWGEAEEDSLIKAEIGGVKTECRTENGKFKLSLNSLKAGGPFELNITSGGESIVLKNILVGDVWLAGGQSNMEYNLKDAIGGEEEILKSNYPEIRYYQVPKIEYEDGEKKIPNVSDEGWKISSPETSGDFSAVAYYFAKNINSDIKVPIGIIGCNKGGTSASCWMAEEYLEEDENIKEQYLDTYIKVIENLTEEEEDSLTKDYYNTLKEYTEKEAEYKRSYPERTFVQMSADIGNYPWPPPMGRKCYLRPNGLYHTMVKKIIPYTLKGVLWYQGEEDTSKPRLYKKLFSNLIKNWRRDFNNSKLPFLFVQLPMFNDGSQENWTLLRDAQLYTYRNEPNTSMIVTVDCGDKDDVHPKFKKPVGERLALLAKQDIYLQNINGHSPIYSDFKIIDDKIIVSFDFVKPGDLVTEDNGEPKGFEVCGEDGKFYTARAAIIQDKVQVWNEEVRTPRYVRYGWRNYIELNLFNKNGLPVSPFNTQNRY